MENKIRDYLEDLFADAPQTKKVYELKEEMFQNLIEKYRDLLAEGMPEEAAYNIAVAGIGDINDLIRSLDEPFYEADYRNHNRSAILTAVGVIIIILSVIPVLLFEALHLENIGICLMIGMVALGVGLLIYTAKQNRNIWKKKTR